VVHFRGGGPDDPNIPTTLKHSVSTRDQHPHPLNHPHHPHSTPPTPPPPPHSTGTFFQRGHNPVISRIEERVAAATMVPVENQEGLQLLHYENGQKYGEGLGGGQKHRRGGGDELWGLCAVALGVGVCWKL